MKHAGKWLCTSYGPSLTMIVAHFPCHLRRRNVTLVLRLLLSMWHSQSSGRAISLLQQRGRKEEHALEPAKLRLPCHGGSTIMVDQVSLCSCRKTAKDIVSRLRYRLALTNSLSRQISVPPFDMTLPIEKFLFGYIAAARLAEADDVLMFVCIPSFVWADVGRSLYAAQSHFWGLSDCCRGILGRLYKRLCYRLHDPDRSRTNFD